MHVMRTYEHRIRVSQIMHDVTDANVGARRGGRIWSGGHPPGPHVEHCACLNAASYLSAILQFDYTVLESTMPLPANDSQSLRHIVDRLRLRRTEEVRVV